MRISDWSSDVCSSDLNVRTEIYAEGSWMELPIGLDSITIIPGTLAQRAFGLPPTLHRVLHRNDDEYIEKDAIIDDQIGRASCRARVCKYVSISVVAVSLKQKK